MHPVLVHFPIALLCTSAIWGVVRKQPEDQRFAWCLWCVGTAAAVLACTFGIIEYLPHRRGPVANPAMSHQLWGLGVALSALAWAMWRGYQRHQQKPDPGHQPWGRALALVISAGVLCAAAGGGALVTEHGIGVTLPLTSPNGECKDQ